MRVILQAAREVIVEHGMDDATTARIAERAGVSVGSLYQYFPNKDSIVSRLVDAQVEGFLAAMQEALRSTVDGTFETSFEALLRALIQSKADSVELNRVLVNYMGERGAFEVASQLKATIAQGVQALAEESQLSWGGREPSVVCALLVHAVDGALEEALRSHPALFKNGSIVTEMRHLALGFLRPLRQQP